MATTVHLGNTAVVEKFRDHSDNEVKVRARPDLRNQITEVHLPDGTGLIDTVRNIADLWQWHSDADGPEWVESSDPIVAVAVAEHFTTDDHECVVGRPDGWNEG